MSGALRQTPRPLWTKVLMEAEQHKLWWNHPFSSRSRSFPHSFQGTDLPSHGSGPSTNPTGLRRKEGERERRWVDAAASDVSWSRPHTFFDQIDDVVDVEADLVCVLAHVLVQGPAAGPGWSGLGFGSREGSLSDAPLPLFPVMKTPKLKINEALISFKSHPLQPLGV